MVTKGRTKVLWGRRLSLSEHTPFLNYPWREFYVSHRPFALFEGSVRERRLRENVGKFEGGNSALMFVEGRRGR
jgi:hypothetical protein